MIQKYRKWVRALTLIALVLAFFIPNAFAEVEEDSVYIIPITGVIDPGLANFLDRSVEVAEEEGVSAVIMEINTPGGRVDAAVEMKETILNAEVPIYAFITNQAASAGVLISIASEKVAMAPGTTIGAAEPRPAEEKIISAWRSELKSAAEARDKNPIFVEAMADKDVEIEGIIEKGKILTLSNREAIELGVADLQVEDRGELLTELNLDEQKITEVQPGLAERLARFITHPYVSPVLLGIGFAGLILEILTLGWGIAGTIGVASILLYFGGHIVAGFAGFEALIIFGLGILALMIEAFVLTGFGVAGIIGLALIIWSIFIASATSTQALISIILALVVSIGLLVIGVKYLGKPKVWNKLILGEKQESKAGYNSPKKDLNKYIGFSGKAITPLRPSGTIEVSGEPIDVVSEGSFIAEGAEVRIVKVESSRVIVRKII